MGLYIHLEYVYQNILKHLLAIQEMCQFLQLLIHKFINSMIDLKHDDVLQTSLKGYFIWKFLGEGSTSRVYQAIRQTNIEKVAIKVIPKAYLNSDKKIYQLVKTEIYILKNHQSQNIVRCLDVFQSSTSIFIVTQYCDNFDLQHYLRSKKYLSQDNAVMFLRQILNGFKGLHQMNMMHRDFKLANILLRTDKICKIGDLGFAKRMQEGALTQSILGTYITMAPQVIQGKPYGLGADIWSIGVVFYQMIFGEYPYKAHNQKLLLKSIKTKQLNFEEVSISRQCQDFIRQCLQADPSKRITWPQIYKHPLICCKKVQIIYGIFTPINDFQEKQKFYERKTQQFQNPEMIQLDTSFEYSRKTLINNIIEQKAQNGRQSFQVFRTSASYDEQKQIILKCAKKYIMYINSISHPCKFMTRRILNAVDATTFDNLAYLDMVYQKVEQSLLECEYVMKKKINLFKIKDGWEKFNSSKYYIIVQQILNLNIQRVKYNRKRLDKKIDKKIIKQVQKTSSQSNGTILSKNRSQKDTSIFKSASNQILKYMIERMLRSKDNGELQNLIRFSDSLLFFLRHQNRTAQQFDIYMARKPKNIEKKRDELIKKMNQIKL